MALACRQARRLSLATVAGHARESERLELEAHLSRCARCSEEHGALSLVRRLRTVETDSVSLMGRQSIRRALAVGSARVVTPPRRALWPFSVAAGGLAVVALLGVLALHQRSYHLLGGDVVASTAGPAGLSALFPGPVTFRSTAGGSVGVGDARADLASGTLVTWAPRERTMILSKGAVTFDVAHQVGRRFQVRTPRFIVEVVGTRFTVDLAGVRTQRGVVRILRPNGTLVGRVEAGQTWRDWDDSQAPVAGSGVSATVAAVRAPSLDTTAAVVVPMSAATTRTMTAPVSLKATPVASGGGGKLGGLGSGLGAHGSGASLSDRLIEARHCLSRGDAITARRLVSPFFHQGRDLAVEARVLFAESFLVEGRYADAVDAYRIVARDFPRSEQAETSMFAIAQLESEHGRGGDARAALRAYVTRYPRGRFVREAGDRLNRLPSFD